MRTFIWLVAVSGSHGELLLATEDGTARASVPGRCGTRAPDRLVHSTADETSARSCRSVFGRWYDNSTPTLQQCALRCSWCPVCRYASFSQLQRDCSLYSACDVEPLLPRGYGYRTVDVAMALAAARPKLARVAKRKTQNAHRAKRLAATGSSAPGGSLTKSKGRREGTL